MLKFLPFDIISLIGKREKFFLPVLFCVIFLLYLPQSFFPEHILRDAANRYAPMAEAFASGNWQYAFHPRVQWLHPFVSGCFTRLSGCSGFVGIQLSALFFFGLCLWPLYRLLKFVFDRDIAIAGSCCLPLLSQTVLICLPGLRESHKMLALLLMTLGILTVYREREKYSGYLLTGLGCGLAFAVRNDILLLSLLLCTAAGSMEFAFLKSLKRSFACLGIILPFAAIEITVNYLICGYAVPGNRFLPLLLKISPEAVTPGGMCLFVIPAGLVLFCIASITGGYLQRTSRGRKILWGLLILFPLLLALKVGLLLNSVSAIPKFPIFKSYIKSIAAGCNPPLSIFAVIGICRILLTKKWTASQTFLLILFFAWILQAPAQILFSENSFYLSERYLLPATPLLLGWAVYGIDTGSSVFKWLLPRCIYRSFMMIALAVFPLICIFHAYSHIFPLKKNPRKAEQIRTTKLIPGIIKQHYRGPAFGKTNFDMHFYRSCRRPKIAYIPSGKETVTAYLSGGSTAHDTAEADFIITRENSVPQQENWERIAQDLPFGKIKLQIWKRRDRK